MLTIVLILVSLAAVAAAATAYGSVRWTAGTHELRARLEAARLPMKPPLVDFRELEGLPAPVQRYFRNALAEGRPVVTGVRLRHRGSINLGETTDRWKPFTSDQRVVIRRPGFDWNARIGVMPGIAVRVHDAYTAGEGLLQAAWLGLFPFVDLRGTREMAEGQLMRFLAEAAWYPTALLPSQGVRWQSLDVHSASAAVTDGSVTVTMRFRFNGEGRIETVRAEARARTVGKQIIPTPWCGRVWNYQERAGMQVPLDAEVSWLLPEGEKPYWRGRITEIGYEFAQ